MTVDRFLSRREVMRICGLGLLASPLAALTGCGKRAATSFVEPAGAPYEGTDEQLLDEIQRAAFNFFWNEASQKTGQVKDRALANGNDSRMMSSIAATGFGLTSLCIGDRRGYGKAPEILERVRRIDSSLLYCGVLTARQYFADQEIKDLATKIYERVDWPWMLNGGKTFSMGWHPESGFLDARWEHYCELMMIYLLAIGSPTHPVPPSSWNAWTRPKITYQGIEYISGDDPIFTHQYSQAWFDFRNKRDAYADYFENSVKATRAHKLFCLSLHERFPDYDENLWGISASDYVKGYTAWGGPPPQGPIDGSVVPCATGGSLSFLFDDCIRVLRKLRGQYRDKVWKKYGFVDAFNPLTGWHDADVLGIDLGITMLMAENHRTSFVWNMFMKNPETQSAMRKVGFHPTS